jgi:hypothetical protein
MIKIELVIRHPEGKPDITCPVLVCDYCGEKIDSANKAICHWREGSPGEVKDGTLLIYHKGACNHLAEQQEREDGATGFPWWPMDWLYGYLINNTGVKWSRLIEDFCPPDQLTEVKKTVRELKKEDTGRMGGL